ncbi:hypothetical protein C8D87_105116 [Lentzea atacamensis]|uniref:Uncharacterized protein n=1 Tax=Lentzea atacamensis TaxID=531938 RepID=A0ABX9E775_9PSEU|nr:hypothetical protein [Lentzea atacamensis]RAS64627.1 hypothetical protein C8D87_105116 [Lentzea atacamensis]
MFRYEVVHWYEDDHDEIVEVLARAVDTDGLFARPRPGDRERVVLRGCPPSFAGLTGNCMLEIGTDDEWQWWSLEDLVVHGTVPDGDLIDVVASAEVRLVDDGPGLGPCCNLSTAGARVGGCRGVDGFPRQWEGLDWPPVALIGVDHPERIRPLDRRKHSWAGGERLHALDRHGHVMAKVPIDLDVASVTPSALGDGLFDVVLDQSDSEERPDPSHGRCGTCGAKAFRRNATCGRLSTRPAAGRGAGSPSRGSRSPPQTRSAASTTSTVATSPTNRACTLR